MTMRGLRGEPNGEQYVNESDANLNNVRLCVWGVIMAYIVNSSGPGLTASSPDRVAKLGRLALLSATATGLVALFETGHPFFAAWAALALLASLFVAGASYLDERSAD